MKAKRSVIVITYGRTGSTLLVGLLNSAEKTLIRGENGNFFFNLVFFPSTHIFGSFEFILR